MGSCNESAAQMPLRDDILKAELMPNALPAPSIQRQDMGNSMSVSGSLPHEELLQSSVDVAGVDALSLRESLQEIQRLSLNTSLSLDACCPPERNLSKCMQPSSPRFASVSSTAITSVSSSSGIYSVQSALPPRHAGELQSENSSQMTGGKSDSFKQYGSAQPDTLRQGTHIRGSQSQGRIAIADGNVPMGFNAPGTELSLAIASVVDSGADQASEESHLTFGTGVFPLNGLAQTISDSESIERSISRKDEMFLKLVQRVRELEVQAQERKEWAHQKAMQAACKFSKDMSELKSLRLEHEEILRLKRDTQALEDSTMKRLSEMEIALRKAGAQVDRANVSVRKLETENAELRAEMEAAKLSAAESNAIQQEVAKREKKSTKRIQAWEKQKAKLLEEIAREKQHVADAQQTLSAVNSQQHEAEMKWRQEEKAKDEAVLLGDNEKWAREQLEIAAKRKEESWRRKAEADFQRYKDDIKRLESELEQLKVAAETVQASSVQLSSAGSMHSTDSSDLQILKDINTRLLRELAELQDSRGDIRRDHECVMCMSEESAVVFLPCAHQIICSQCNELHEKQEMRECPSCRTVIQHRILVFGPGTA